MLQSDNQFDTIIRAVCRVSHAIHLEFRCSLKFMEGTATQKGQSPAYLAIMTAQGQAVIRESMNQLCKQAEQKNIFCIIKWEK
mgnify:CR=1 FL=1